MCPPIFGASTFNQLPHLMNTKNPPCLNGEKVELAMNLLRVFNHKHRFAIVNKLLDKGGMDTSRLAASLRLQESYILEHLQVLQQTGIVSSIDMLDGIKFVANKRAISKVNNAVRSFSQN
ncbi:MAG: ArsR family transcriptional regulator [Bacteroidetes bacterium]|nr:ArsR family transcriptional regulator [Bacteroidota bacterium]